jgi:hypothetical protein
MANYDVIGDVHLIGALRLRGLLGTLGWAVRRGVGDAQ